MSWTKEEKAKIRQNHRYLKEILNKDAMETIMDHYIEADFYMSVAKQIIHLFSISEKFEGLCKFIENIQLTPDGYSFFLHILRKCNYGYIAERIESTTIAYGRQNRLSGKETQAEHGEFLQQTEAKKCCQQTMNEKSLQETQGDECIPQTWFDKNLQQTTEDERLHQTWFDKFLQQKTEDARLQQTWFDKSLQQLTGDIQPQTPNGQVIP